MLGRSIQLGRIFGIRIGANPSWFVVLFLLIWLLTGQGSQYAGMAGGLRDEPAFAGPFRDCCELLDPLLPAPLAATLWESGVQCPADQTTRLRPGCLGFHASNWSTPESSRL